MITAREILSARTALRLSVRQLDELSGVPSALIHKAERGRAELNPGHSRQLQAALEAALEAAGRTATSRV